MSLTEFKRINEPRVEKLHKMLDTIEKSASSLKVDAGVLTESVRARLEGRKEDLGGDLPDTPNASPATVPVKRELERLSDLSTQQIVDRMIACGYELGSRRG